MTNQVKAILEEVWKILVWADERKVDSMIVYKKIQRILTEQLEEPAPPEGESEECPWCGESIVPNCAGSFGEYRHYHSKCWKEKNLTEQLGEGLKCKCGTAYIRLEKCSEPEGIRQDAYCPSCNKTFAVHKHGDVEILTEQLGECETCEDRGEAYIRDTWVNCPDCNPEPAPPECDRIGGCLKINTNNPASKCKCDPIGIEPAPPEGNPTRCRDKCREEPAPQETR